MTRIETDSFGSVQVPENCFWGEQTERSRNNFKIGNEPLPLDFIYAYALVKKASALANEDHLDPEIVKVIGEAVDTILTGTLDDQFPVKVWQTGSGTQTNMNLNEVIANWANRRLGHPLGSKSPVHPNDHVNFGMSTNDSFPTAMHIAAVIKVISLLLPQMENCHRVLQCKARDFQDIVKTGRTHLQDAVPLTLGQEFSGYSTQIYFGINRVKSALEELYPLAQGGTAVGTGLNSYPEFSEKFITEISRLTKLPFTSAVNKFEAIAAHDALVSFSGVLNTLAVSLMKIANDLRLMGSGPRVGLSELFLPQNEPGSSIMPGKVNPTQVEALTMIAAQVMGNHVTITIAGSQGQLELNAYKPVIIYNLLQSIQLLADGIQSFTTHCLVGIRPNIEVLQKDLKNSLMLATGLNPHLGYDKTTSIVKKAMSDQISLKEAAVTLGYLTGEQFDNLVSVEKMANPFLPPVPCPDL